MRNGNRNFWPLLVLLAGTLPFPAGRLVKGAEPGRPIAGADLQSVRRAEWGGTEYAVEFTPWGHTRWNDWGGFWRLEGDVLVLTSVHPRGEWRVPLTRGPKGMLTGVEERGTDVVLLP